MKLDYEDNRVISSLIEGMIRDHAAEHDGWVTKKKIERFVDDATRDVLSLDSQDLVAVEVRLSQDVNDIYVAYEVDVWAVGQGDAVHPDPDPDPEETP